MCLWPGAPVHSSGSPHPTAQSRVKIKTPPFVSCPTLKTAPIEAGPLREDEPAVALTASCQPLWLCALLQHHHTQLLAYESAFGLRALVGDCSVPSPKQDGLGMPSLVPPANA